MVLPGILDYALDRHNLDADAAAEELTSETTNVSRLISLDHRCRWSFKGFIITEAERQAALNQASGSVEEAFSILSTSGKVLALDEMAVSLAGMKSKLAIMDVARSFKKAQRVNGYNEFTFKVMTNLLSLDYSFSLRRTAVGACIGLLEL